MRLLGRRQTNVTVSSAHFGLAVAHKADPGTSLLPPRAAARSLSRTVASNVADTLCPHGGLSRANEKADLPCQPEAAGTESSVWRGAGPG
jgi:hypothetical protein